MKKADACKEAIRLTTPLYPSQKGETYLFQILKLVSIVNLKITIEDFCKRIFFQYQKIFPSSRSLNHVGSFQPFDIKYFPKTLGLIFKFFFSLTTKIQI